MRGSLFKLAQLIFEFRWAAAVALPVALHTAAVVVADVRTKSIQACTSGTSTSLPVDRINSSIAAGVSSIFVVYTLCDAAAIVNNLPLLR